MPSLVDNEENNGPDWKLLAWPINGFLIGVFIMGAFWVYANAHSDSNQSEPACIIVIL